MLKSVLFSFSVVLKPTYSTFMMIIIGDNLSHIRSHFQYIALYYQAYLKLIYISTDGFVYFSWIFKSAINIRIRVVLEVTRTIGTAKSSTAPNFWRMTHTHTHANCPTQRFPFLAIRKIALNQNVHYNWPINPTIWFDRQFLCWVLMSFVINMVQEMGLWDVFEIFLRFSPFGKTYLSLASWFFRLKCWPTCYSG